ALGCVYETDTGWYGTGLKLVTRRIDRHTLVMGTELQPDYRDAMRNFDTVPYVSYLDDHRTNNRGGVYVQDQFMLHPDWPLDTGLRYALSRTHPSRSRRSVRAQLWW
ncbi:TonB-dependent receptor, partial [Leclercia adecarboxylata]|uniref:TonB-dependent receptor domain-containing protein n=1 Tax=Leclercia adecarboxylata TaxID=83655 RepID=UPI00234D7426